MKPETEAFLAKAKRRLERAQRMIELDLPEDAARTAYVACFHLAQAGAEAIDPDLRSFLGRSYRYKYAADYATGVDEETTYEAATRAIDMARRFIVHFGQLLR